MRKLSAILSTVAALGFIGVNAAPAMAIDNVVCRDDAGQTQIHNEKRHCFVNAGYTSLHITNVYRVTAGNNNITVYYRLNSNTISSFQLNKGAERYPNPFITVEGLQIH